MGNRQRRGGGQFPGRLDAYWVSSRVYSQATQARASHLSEAEEEEVAEEPALGHH